MNGADYLSANWLHRSNSDLMFAERVFLAIELSPCTLKHKCLVQMYPYKCILILSHISVNNALRNT